MKSFVCIMALFVSVAVLAEADVAGYKKWEDANKGKIAALTVACSGKDGPDLEKCSELNLLRLEAQCKYKTLVGACDHLKVEKENKMAHEEAKKKTSGQ